MELRKAQQGGVLIISLIILLVMTLLGVSAMTHSGLQERMVANQKQAIQAAMAAEAGAITAIRWLRQHPEAWGNTQAWQNNSGLMAESASQSVFGDNTRYWIDTVTFKGDRVTLVCRGGVFRDGEIMAQSTVTVTLQQTISDSPAPTETANTDQASGGITVPDTGSDAFLTDGRQRGGFKSRDQTVVADSPSASNAITLKPLLDINELPLQKVKTTTVILWRQSAGYNQ